MTIPGFKEEECIETAEFIVEIMKRIGSYGLTSKEEIIKKVIADSWFDEMRNKVSRLAKGFPVPGAGLFWASNERSLK